MQTADTSYLFNDASPSKSIDWAVAIAGHGVVYTGATTYTLPSSGGDLNTSNGFAAATKAYAGAPKIDASKMKGARPEEGGFSIGSCEVEFQDRYTDAHNTLREFTDLASRWAYLEGNQTGLETSLSAAITSSATTINLVSTTGITAGDVIHISQEAILVGTVASGTQLTGCTRAYRLTLGVPHLAGVKVYGYMPSLYRRLIYVYKGYQGIPTSSWVVGWGGVIDGVNHSAGALSVHAMATTWELYGGRSRKAPTGPFNTQLRGGGGGNAVRKIVRLGQINDTLNDENMTGNTGTKLLSGDYRVKLLTPLPVPTGLGDGHFVIKIPGGWLGITNPLVDEYEGGIINAGLVSASAGARSTVVADCAKFSGGGTYPNHDLINVGDEFDIGWSNAEFTGSLAPAPDASLLPGFDSLDPLHLVLGFLTSTGAGTNGSYDVFKAGIGLGVPSDLVDATSFTDVIAQKDYDTLMRVFFLFTKPAPAKDFLESELCKPFGWYLATANDGRIKLVRPKNPTKLYFSQANNRFNITHSNSTHARAFNMAGGVYTPAEVATTLQAGIRLATGDSGFLVTVSAGVFRLRSGSGTFTFGSSAAWSTIGHTTATGSSDISGSAVAQFSDTSAAGSYNVLTENDVKDVSPIDSLGSRISEVWFHVNYDWSNDDFRTIKTFTDAEVANLDGDVEPYEIESKGLIAAFSNNRKITSPFAVRLPPATGCTGALADVSSSFGIDASNSFATLFAEHLFDRYRGQPLRFKAKLPWKFNRLEVGDNVQFSYSIDGVFADYELAAGTVSSRVFEVVSVKPDFANARIEAEFLGHRDGG